MTIFAYQLSIATIIMVASYFGRGPWMVAIALTALWTVGQTYGGLMVFQLIIIAGAAVFSNSTFSKRWKIPVGSTEIEKFD